MHFTYSDNDQLSPDLLQGDIICRTPEVEQILQEVHPHYFHRKDNKYFIVLTQDCDLVRRTATGCDARYISLAPIRPVEAIFERQLQQYIEDGFAPELPVCTENNQARFRNFLERLLNNNEASYFYLRREPSKNFPEDCCALLALSIAVKANLHYQTLRNAKLIELEGTFRAKLGWLVGQLYARIGTEDWPSAQLQREISEIVKDFSIWLEPRKLRELKKMLQQWQMENPDTHPDKELLVELIKKIPKRKEQIVQQTVTVLLEKGLIEAAQKTLATNLIRNDALIASLIKD